MNNNVNRRDFIKTAVLTTGAISLSGCGLSKRILGICETKPPQDPGSWTFSGGRIEVDLGRAPELSQAGSAIRLEGEDLPDRILVVRGEGKNFLAFKNRCTHYSGGRRIDPVPGTSLLRCCSVGKSTFDYAGKVVSGPAKGPLPRYPVEIKKDKLVISLNK
jgi:Rieske Fe-S protein